jgi:hypothetical protein
MHIDQAALSGNKNSHQNPTTPGGTSNAAEMARTVGRSSDVQPASQPLPDKDFMLAAIRSATLRARLCANQLDAIGIALNREMINCAGAITWLRDENLLDHVLYRPELLHESAAA